MADESEHGGHTHACTVCVQEASGPDHHGPPPETAKVVIITFDRVVNESSNLQRSHAFCDFLKMYKAVD